MSHKHFLDVSHNLGRDETCYDVIVQGDFIDVTGYDVIIGRCDRYDVIRHVQGFVNGPRKMTFMGLRG